MKCFIIASGQTPIFKENGFQDRNLYEIYIWPLYKIDPRLISMSQYLGKVYEKNDFRNESFDKRNYCIVNM